LVSGSSRRLGVATAALALALATVVARGQGRDGQDDDSVFRGKLDLVLDRWNDDAPADRRAAAIELCEGRLKELSKASIEDRTPHDDSAVRLELARFLLSEEKWDKGAIEASRAAEASPVADRKAQAMALHFIAFRAGAGEGLAATERTPDQGRVAAKEFEKKVVDLWAKLAETAGSEDAAKKLVNEERDRIAIAGTLKFLGKPAPALAEKVGANVVEKKDTAGNPIVIASYAGKVLLVDFWASWAKPSVDELPNTLSVYQQWKDKGFDVVGFSLDNDRAKLDEVVAQWKLPWRQCFTGKGMGDEAAKAWDAGFPRRFLIDHTGRVRFVDVRGPGLAAAVKQLVERATQKPMKKKGE
jgi:thiol-disulfide isomerase/thioredoxin